MDDMMMSTCFSFFLFVWILNVGNGRKKIVHGFCACVLGDLYFMGGWGGGRGVIG